MAVLSLFMNCGAKAALKPPHSKRYRARPCQTDVAKRLECGGFSTAFRIARCRIKVALLLMLCLPALAPLCPAAEFHVAPGGVDTNPGTADQPLATVAAALRKARDLRRLKDPSADTGVRITVRGGTYSLSSPLFIRPEDSGAESSPTTIAAAPGEHAVLSGGV